MSPSHLPHLLANQPPQVPPWHSNAALAYLAADLTTLLESWLAETTSSHVSSSPYSVSTTFPATQVDTAIGKYLMVLTTTGGAAQLVARLQDVQRVIRKQW